MKKATIELIEAKWNKDIEDINWEIRKNVRLINDLAEKQRKLKATRRGLYEILRLIK